MRSFLRLACLPALAGLVFLSPLHAQRGAGNGRTPTSAAISPDGKVVAWTIGTQLHVTDATNPDPAKDKIVTPNGGTSCSNTSPVWSPDGAWLAYTSTCTSKEEKPGQAQIFLWSRATGESKQLTHLVGRFKQAAWSPDGKQIAMLFVPNASRDAGALDAMKPWAGVIGEDGVEVQEIEVVSAKDGGEDWHTIGQHVYEFGWAPDSRNIAYIAANPPGENTWWIAKLFSTSVLERGAPLHVKTSVVFDPARTKTAMHGLQMAVPRYSPDGKSIAFIGGLMSDQGSTGGDVWVVPSKGGEPVDVTPGIDGTPIFESWIDNSKLGFVEDRRGHMWVAGYDVATRKPLPTGSVDFGEVSISGGPIKGAISLSGVHGVVAFVKSSPTMPAEVWTGPLQSMTQLTHLSDGQPKSTAHVESVEWENEGLHVQGWLTYPRDYDAKKKYPMIVTVHGGPTSSAFARGAGQWSGLGYFEFQPNPRGSMGQGEAFVQANRKDFGYGDLRDILTGIDAVEKKVSIDDHRIGLTGWSYGGFMSMFAATQTGRFAAIVAGAGISNWQSYYGENSIDQWMIPFFGASVYDDPAVYAQSSAITFIKKAAQYKTPMLIIVGDRDGECPAPQSFEMWHALRDLGVKTQLVVYPNEGHGFRDPEHIRDRNARTAKWFADNMPEKK